MEEAKSIAYESIYDELDNRVIDWNEIKSAVKDDLSRYFYTKTKRKPMILPVIMNV